jgi:hypothetical protein
LARNVIYTVDAAGKLTAMRPSEPRSEDYMQTLVATYPEFIVDQDGALLLIRREQPIGDREESSERWSLDHLFVTRSGIPVLVELKRAVDTRLRREVVGQMLDYAANGTAYWQGGRIATSFAQSMQQLGRDADTELACFLGAGADPQQFWDQVDANFAAGRIKMVFVADTIPRELARIVEFLNEQMKADVRAVELSWFQSDDGITALTLRVFGETERAQTEKAARSAPPPIARETWIADRLGGFGPAAIEGATVFLDMIESTGGLAEVTLAQGSIVAVFETSDRKLYPLALSASGKGSVQLCLAYLMSQPAFASEEIRRTLYNDLTVIVGPLSTTTLSGYPAFGVTKLVYPVVRDGVKGFLENLVQMGRAA